MNQIYTTELSHKKTKNLSQIYNADIASGMELLFSIEEDLILPFVEFETKTKPLLQREIENKKIVLVGSGSSGRIAKILGEIKDNKIDLEAFIAGGDLSLINPQERFEDSQKEGKKFVETYCKNKDILFLISASGSALFNYGAACEAQKAGIKTYYFYNNECEPPKLAELISKHIITPLKFVSGPQAIRGSTRLQSANLALLCFGSLLSLGNSKSYINDVRKNLSDLHHALFSEKSNFLRLYSEIEEIFLMNDAVFYDIKSENGFLTYIVHSELFSTVFADVSELSPTFGENTISKINVNQGDAAIRAYLKNGKERFDEYKLIIDDSEKKRRKGLFLEITSDDQSIYLKTDQSSFMIKKIEASSLKEESYRQEYKFLDLYNLKIILNLISNSLMIRGGKVLGNIMTYVRPCNTKLINRVKSTLSQLLEEENRPELQQNIDGVLNHIYQNNSKSSPIPLAFLMMTKNWSFQEAENYLRHNKWKF